MLQSQVLFVPGHTFVTVYETFPEKQVHETVVASVAGWSPSPFVSRWVVTIPGPSAARLMSVTTSPTPAMEVFVVNGPSRPQELHETWGHV